MQNFHLQFSTAISTCAALTLWYQSIRPNESTVEWQFTEKDGICWITYTLNTSHRLTNKGIQLWSANLVTSGIWIHDWVWKDQSQNGWGLTISTCPLIGGYTLPVWCLLWSKAHWWPKVMGSYTICWFFCVFIMHWPHGMNVIACLPLSISHDSSHWGSC